MMNPRNSPLSDKAIASLLGLVDLRIDRHSFDAYLDQKRRDFPFPESLQRR